MSRLLDGLVAALRRLAMAALVGMMAVTVVDVGMRLIINELVLGSVEIVELMLVASVFLALPETFRANRQITVDVIDQIVGPRATRLLKRIAAVLTALVMAVMAWRVVPPALDTIVIGDETTDLQISLAWYWLPLVVGVVVAAIAAIVGIGLPDDVEPETPDRGGDA